MLVSKNSQMEVNTGIQQQAQRVEVFTIDEISEPSKNSNSSGSFDCYPDIFPHNQNLE